MSIALPTEGTVRVTFDARGRFNPSRNACGRGRLDDGRTVMVSVDRATWEGMGAAFALGTDAVYVGEIEAWRIVRVISPLTPDRSGVEWGA